MADLEHVAVVKRSAAALRRWRKKHPEDRLDLWYADLRGIDLTGAYLRGVDLRGADLTEAHLRGAHLWHAHLAGAHLIAADLTGADLTGADLTHARLSSTVLADCDLSSCKGLDAAEHEGPSNVATSTLALTLQGCGGTFTPPLRAFFVKTGVPDQLLEYLPDFYRANPIRFYSVFVSYAHDDEPRPTYLYEDLKAAGVPVWQFKYDALPGDDTREIIDRQIAVRDKVVLVCSEKSLDRPWIKREIDRALKKEDDLRATIQQRRKDDPSFDMDWRVLFPVMLDKYALDGWNPIDGYLKEAVCSRNIADLTRRHGSAGWKAAVETIVKALDPASRRLELLVPSARKL